MTQAKEMSTRAGLALGIAGLIALSGATFAYSSVQYQVKDNWAVNSLDNNDLKNDFSYNTPNVFGGGVKVYVLDSGVDFTHPVFNNVKHSSMDFFETKQVQCPMHATAVAGVVAQVAPAAEIVSMRVTSCSKDRHPDYWALVKSLEWISVNAVQPSVVNISLTFQVVDERVDDLIQKIINKGITVVGSAGNVKKDTCTYSPTHVADVIVAGGIDRNFLITKDSAEGKCVDIFAPYQDVLVADYASKSYNTKSGTSFSAPFVSGASVLYLSKHSDAVPAEVNKWLTDNATSGSKGYFWKTNFNGTTDNILYIPNVIQ